LQPGESYTVPPAANAPLLRAGAPEALRVTVGDAEAPPVGPAGQVTSNVSLLPEDLMGNRAAGGAQAAQPTQN
jgi:cytoskeleton protein RodZ